MNETNDNFKTYNECLNNGSDEFTRISIVEETNN